MPFKQSFQLFGTVSLESGHDFGTLARVWRVLQASRQLKPSLELPVPTAKTLGSTIVRPRNSSPQICQDQDTLDVSSLLKSELESELSLSFFASSLTLNGAKSAPTQWAQESHTDQPARSVHSPPCVAIASRMHVRCGVSRPNEGCQRHSKYEQSPCTTHFCRRTLQCLEGALQIQ